MTTVQTVAEQPLPTSNSLVKTIAWVGLLAGSLDIMSACLQAYLMRGTTPIIVLQYIASGAFGKVAFSGGWLMPLLGLLFHYIIAYSFTTLFFIIYPSIKFFSKNIVLTAIIYGIFIFIAMNMVVLRFTKVPPITFHLDKAMMATGILIVAIGLPVAYFARKYYRNR
ncbi:MULTISPECIES: hypothetical protein [Niastella]|uniref:DUF1440 domain-containing protein n=1 Tax=Niastella soli TaxID=2821487 RepID=A0ABS3YS90_9BACT|nr:hypothetical protein [Niastella soli]MBO9200653.1 hypothetical protein [Niastella soli]